MIATAEQVELTARQRDIFNFIKQRISGGLPPTVREIMERLEFTSPNGAMCHLRALAKKGFIKRDNKARSIRLVGDCVCPKCGRDLSGGAK